MKPKLLMAILVVGAVAAAGCGGGGGSSDATTKKKAKVAATTTTVAAPPTVLIGDSTIGRILVDAGGRTLYQLDRDGPSSATCTGACANLWPPLIASGAPHAGAGVDAAKLTSIAGPNGQQVTYAGHPLYRFANDVAPGDTNGQGFGDVWWVLGGDGAKVTTMPAASSVPPTTAAAEPTAPPSTEPPATDPPTAPPTYDYGY